MVAAWAECTEPPANPFASQLGHPGANLGDTDLALFADRLVDPSLTSEEAIVLRALTAGQIDGQEIELGLSASRE